VITWILSNSVNYTRVFFNFYFFFGFVFPSVFFTAAYPYNNTGVGESVTRGRKIELEEGLELL
jgi:hypothetical protein